MTIIYRDVLPEDGRDHSANFSSFIDELEENPNLGLVLRKVDQVRRTPLVYELLRDY